MESIWTITEQLKMMKMSPSEIFILKYCAFSNHLKKIIKF